MSHQRQAERMRRSLSRMTIENVEAQRSRERSVARVSAGDMAQQLQVKISGKVGRTAIFLSHQVTFQYPFLMQVARSQSEGTPNHPHFSSGVEVRTEQYLNCDAQVRHWVVNDSSFVTGAVIRIAVFAPEAPKLTPYSAIIHLTFFGYAAPVEDDNEG